MSTQAKKNVRLPKDCDDFLYFTQRSLYAKGDERKDNWGTTEHSAKLWVFKDEPVLVNIEYSCPNCGHKDSKQQDYVEPVEFECVGCGKIIKVPKLDKRLSKKTKKSKKSEE